MSLNPIKPRPDVTPNSGNPATPVAGPFKIVPNSKKYYIAIKSPAEVYVFDPKHSKKPNGMIKNNEAMLNGVTFLGHECVRTNDGSRWVQVLSTQLPGSTETQTPIPSSKIYLKKDDVQVDAAYSNDNAENVASEAKASTTESIKTIPNLLTTAGFSIAGGTLAYVLASEFLPRTGNWIAGATLAGVVGGYFVGYSSILTKK
jgi:hypothetical protein